MRVVGQGQVRASLAYHQLPPSPVGVMPPAAAAAAAAASFSFFFLALRSLTPSFTTGSVLVGVIAAGGIAGEVRPLIIDVAGGVGILIVAGIGGREGGGVEAGIVGVVLVNPPPPPMPPNPMISLIPPIGGIDGVEEEVAAPPPPPPSPNRSLIPPLGVVVVGGTGAGGGAGRIQCLSP